ncbi:hypothetical protein N7509_005558 [Penicillium cosmopolitanum]|uniref:DUF614 domain protein n=1 Tax=Penicillium cosmopolitanum TaxID=1131564 RepID=A0A9W9W2F9_9EURO|nr:uncharacterized protein N7509_005558 [Penicillium cosmopolitanum]KAJ5397445.1 hypothetical protein N7509_005558 [Penicillium cosmopolitanum]
MNRPQPLQLNTQVGQNQRYSFIETPLEMNARTQNYDLESPPPMPANPPPVHRQEQPTPEQPIQQPQAAVVYQEDEQESQVDEGSIPTYSRYPQFDQHPVHFAPAADTPQPQPQQLQIDVQSPQYAYGQPPYSPGPLPPKTNPEPPRRADTFTITPDANPLQSPRSPFFPPPPASAPSQTPAIDDLATYHQPGQIMHPNQEVMGGAWHHGLCECSNLGTCCMGLLCPCILYGKTQHRLSLKSRKEDPTNMLGYETCNGSCTAMALLCGCQWLFATIQHTRTRNAYGIQGGIASDCVRATCCTCCTLIQDEKEIQEREKQRGRAALERGATLLSPYTAPGPMAYPPPPK